MPIDSLSVFAGGSATQTLSGPSTPARPAGTETDPATSPLLALADKLRNSLAVIQSERQKEIKALEFPYVVSVETVPVRKLRLSSGVSTFLIVTDDPISGRLEFSKYSFTPDEQMKLITRLLTEAGYDMNPQSPGKLQIGDYIRPAGY